MAYIGEMQYLTIGNNTYSLPTGGGGDGTVTSIAAGVGLTTDQPNGGAITSTGTIKAKLNSETSLGTIGTTSKLYAVGVDANGKLCVSVPWSDNTNTTYSLSNASSSHKFTETLTAGGSGSGTSTATMEFAAGTGITLTDDTTNKKITIACSITDTDEKVKRTIYTSTNPLYPILHTDKTGTSTAYTSDISFYQYYNTAGGYRRLDLGNSTAYKSTGGAYGTIRLYGAAATYYGDLVPGVLGTTSGDGHISANRTWTLPDKTGTIALTSDIPDVSSFITVDEKVKQSNNTTSNANLRILFSQSAIDTDQTSTVYKSTNLTYNPSTKTLSTDNLQTTQINGVTVGSSPKFTDTNTISAWYGTCSSNSTTETKIVSCSGFTLSTGALIAVHFSSGNQLGGAIKLNVNSTGDKPIYYKGAAVSTSNMLYWQNDENILFSYDGTNYQYVSNSFVVNEIGSSTSVSILLSTDAGNKYKSSNLSFSSGASSNSPQLIIGDSSTSTGILTLGNNGKQISITPTTLSASRTITLPDKTGTVALTSDIPDVSSFITVDENVKQVNTTGTDTYRILFSYNANDNTETVPVRKSKDLKFTTTTGNLQTIQLNGVTVGSSPKFTDSEVSTLTLASGSTAGTSLSFGSKYTLTAGSKTVSFTMPSSPTVPTITLNGSATTSPSFYAPTSAGTSGYVLKSNGSGAPSWGSAILTDKKLEVAEVTTNIIYYPIVGTGASASTRQYDTTGFKYSSNTGTSSTMGSAKITLGNSISSGTAGNKVGQIEIYGRNNKSITFEMADVETSTNCYLPNKTGTIALTSDLSSYLPLSGGTMTGNIIMDGLGILGKSSINDNANYLIAGLNKTDNFIYVGSDAGKQAGVPIGIYGSNVTLSRQTGDLTLSGYIHLPNLSSNGGLKIANSSGNYYRALYCTASNSLVLGYDWYAEEGGKIGQTYIGGSQLFLRSPDGPITATADINATGFKATSHGGGTVDNGYIGDIVAGSKTSGLSALSKSSTDYTSTGATFTLGAGSWMIVAQVRFPAKSGGNRKVALKVGTTTYNVSRNTCSSPTSSAIDLLTSLCIAISSSSTIDVLGWQNSDSDITPTQVYWRAIRIA